MLKNKKFLLAVTAVLISLFFAPLASQAITAEGVGVSPAHPDPKVPGSDIRFIYNLDRGKSLTDALKLTNVSASKSVKVKIYAVDAVISNQGVFNPLDEADPKTGIANWLKISQPEVTLKPGETKLVPFTLTIPKNASVGDHLGAIVAEKGELKPSGQAGLSIKTRVAIKLWNTVPGDIVKNLQITHVGWEINNKKLSVAPTTWEKIQLALGLSKEGSIILTLKNQGNVYLMPTGHIEINDIFGGRVATLNDIALGNSSFDQESVIPIKWDKPSLFGFLTAKITLLYGDNQTATAQKSFWIIPWTLLFIIIILAMIFIFGRLLLRLFYAKAKLKMTAYQAASHETLAEIADQHHVSWKKLARINGLKPPYNLKENHTIFIPKKK